MLAVGAVAALTAAFDGPAATLLRAADRYELFPREEEVRYRYVLKWEPVHAVGTFFAFKRCARSWCRIRRMPMRAETCGSGSPSEET